MSSAGRGTFNDSRRIWLKHEKMAAFAPMPSASDTMAMAVTNGVLNSVRRGYLREVIGRLDGRGAGEVYETPSIADCRLQIADRRIADCRLPIDAIVDWALAIGHWRLGIGDWSLATRKPLEFLCQPAPLVLPTFGGFSRLDEDRRQFVCLLNQGLGVVHRHLVRRHEELKPPLRFVRFFGGQADLREELT